MRQDDRTASETEYVVLVPGCIYTWHAGAYKSSSYNFSTTRIIGTDMKEPRATSTRTVVIDAVCTTHTTCCNAFFVILQAGTYYSMHSGMGIQARTNRLAAE